MSTQSVEYGENMQKKDYRLSPRVYSRRLEKLRKYAEQREKSVTEFIENWLDNLEIPEKLPNLLGLI
ncbi:MAG: hypothetical protein F6J89_01425 [Symploca sp. SIO1C4]|uniref:Ribbon-helix-helix protein, CopG family n=1 Tax=Symploca sp. SIO1C4 TaxID=2607765 RepID=A0A6B3N448_9CYAN|nr:hypothetical protein [Symploca sp. SIO1C4]